MTAVAPSEVASSPFTPKLLTFLRSGYGVSDLRADAVSGLTVAIVALPLSMAIAIASGLAPGAGLVTAAVGGFLVSALGGSRYQIGGPAGAFIVVVATTVTRFGLDGLIIATFLSGAMMMMAGYLRVGTLIRHVPHTVVVSFTGAIAFIIFINQVKDLLGLHLRMTPGSAIEMITALWGASASLTPATCFSATSTILSILILHRLRPRWPATLLGIVVVSIVVFAARLHVDTIGSRFGSMPRLLPAPHIPSLSLATVVALLPTAASFALLGSIESLLSASVADRLGSARHRSNCELVGQGIANIGTSLFGGFCVTGTIARTATNVRSGARSPMSGIFCALFVLAFMLVGAPLASYVPLSALAAVLCLVAWSMADRHEIIRIARASKTSAIVMLVTFALVVFRGLGEGIIAGCAMTAMVSCITKARRAVGATENYAITPPRETPRHRRRDRSERRRL